MALKGDKRRGQGGISTKKMAARPKRNPLIEDISVF
jgi:hypothetical protein